VVGFLTPGRGTSSIDGGSRLPWDGPGGSLVRSSWDALDKRTEQVMIADPVLVSINETVQEFYESGGAHPGKLRAALEPASARLDVALAAYQKALEFEERRLYLVKKATAVAEQSKDPIPGIDVDLVDRRLAALLDGRISSAIELRIKGYRSLTGGLVAFIDGESLTALEQMKAAAEALPDMAVAQAYLGSLYFLFQQTDPAVAAWKKALALDPNNDAVRAALKEYGRKGR
jgi:tetratricopeptide (TPR) repeat protein